MKLKKWSIYLVVILSIILITVQCQVNEPLQVEPEELPVIEDIPSKLITLPPLPAWANGALPDFNAYKNTQEKKTAFFEYIYQRVALASARIMLERNNLFMIMNESELGKGEISWVERQSKRLAINPELSFEEKVRLLSRRLDILPASVILAQAAKESGWGTSRFAREGNNLFGQWCFSQGCGLVPKGRAKDKSHEVAKFSTPYFSVRSYIQNLNRHSMYKNLRDIREQDHAKGLYTTGPEVTEGLLGYSERGQIYVEEIQKMIEYNKLAVYDKRLVELLDVEDYDALYKLAGAEDPQML